MGYNKMLGGGGFHHVAIKVRDFDKSVAMYKEVLGCTEVAAWGTDDKRGVMLDTGDGACLEVFAGGSGDAPANGFYHLALRAADVDAVIDAARAFGLVVTMEPTDIVIASTPPMPARIGFFNGFDGESIELFHNR